MKLDWNRERYRTRDRLLTYNLNHILPFPQLAPVIAIDPYERAARNILMRQLYDIAKQYGFIGTSDDFFSSLGKDNLVRGTLSTFPVPGENNKLYLDEETSILYYFRAADEPINLNNIEIIGAHIAGTDNNTIYIYIPVRALPMENTIYDCGTAAEFID